jgi:glycerophosphoryl diester phosphodiesterase
MVIYAAYFFGLLPFLSLKESMFVVPSPYLLDKFYSAKISPSLNSRFKRFLVFCLLKFCKFLMSREGLYKHLSKRGIGTIFWVVQNDCEFQQSFALGAQGVMTDYPSRLSRFLSSSKEDRDSKSHLD